MLSRRFAFPETNGFIIRRTLDDLRDNHIRPLLREYPALANWYNKQEKVLNFPNGSWTRFISSDNYDDIFLLYGKEAADVFVDQAEQFTQEQLEFLQTINRCTTNIDITPKMLFTFNPGNVGHAHLKRVFLERDYTGNEVAEDYGFIRAYGWDNVEWCRRALRDDGITDGEFYGWASEKRRTYFITRSDYGNKLNALPDSQRQAELDGSFDVFEGQFFSMWRRDVHIIDAIRKPENPDWPIVGCIDYGQRSVMEVQFRDYAGRIINFAECWTEYETPAERFNAMADTLLERELFGIKLLYDTNMDINLKYYTGYDKMPSTIAREVFRDRMGANAPRLQVVSKATTDKRGYRVVANEAVKQALSWRRGTDGNLEMYPQFVVTRDCVKLISTMPVLIADPTSPDGLDFDQKVGCDDPYDACKMALLDLRTPREKVQKKPVAHATISDMDSREYAEKNIFSRRMEKVLKRGKTRADAL